MDIGAEIELLKTTRKHMLSFLETLSMEQLLEIPTGLNNNIFWNVAHAVVTQQLLVYKLSNTEMRLHGYWVGNFRKGSKAGQVDVGERELIDLKEYIIESPVWLEKDYESEKFGVFTNYPTSFGIELKSVEDAIAFNNLHEGLHLGYAMAQKKLILS